jgi:ubiquinone/menaquinone biosynthesis C-methylase UbiE
MIPEFDAVEYKAGQRRSWDTAATGWRRWWRTIERSLQPLGDRMLDLAQIRPGQRVLDVATGIGEPAISAAARVGPMGSVVAIDLAPEMLEIARERVRQAGVGIVELLEADAEALDLAPASFDAVLCRFGLMFLPDPGRGLSRLRALLKSGGRLAAAVWGPPAKVPMLAMPMAAILRELQLPPRPPGLPGVFSLCDAGMLERLAREAGFAAVATEIVETVTQLPSADDFVHFCQDVASPIQDLLAKEGADRQAQAWQAVRRAAAASFGQPDGGISLRNEAILLSAEALPALP